MSYTVDPNDGDIIISGFEKGIGSDPYSGLTDVKNMNITSIPGEASVAFSTQALNAAPNYSGLSVSALGISSLAVSGLNPQSYLETGQAITFAGSTISGATTGTLFYITGASAQTGTTQNIGITATYGGSPIATLGLTGTATLNTVNMTLGQRGVLTKNYIQESIANTASGATPLVSHWLADSNGRVWSDIIKTSGGTGITTTNSWTYTGNTVDGTTSFGNGLTYLQTINPSGGKDGWLFLFRSAQIDYLKVVTADVPIGSGSLAWVYGWDPGYVTANAGTSGRSGYLASCNTSIGGSPSTVPISHEGTVTPDGRLCYCDGYIIGRFYQNPPVTSGTSIVGTWTAFDPLTTSTYTFNTYPILPTDDMAQCMSYLGSNLLIGGQKNKVYPWNLVDSQYSNPLILLPENFVTSIVTVKQNAYIFAGNRGRIYLTNGSQADLWKKVPDHISGTVQPVFAWGGATYNQNQLYFGLYMAQASGAISSTNVYGGVWGADVNSQSLYLANQTSNAVYTGYVSALFPFTIKDYALTVPATIGGFGLYIGWANTNTSTYGLDVTINTPYTGGQSYVISDAIPIGTLLKPTTATQFEYKLAAPLLTGETLELQVASYPGGGFTSLGTTSGDGSLLSDNFKTAVQGQQWCVVKAIATANGSTPSYVRLKQISIIGATQSGSVQTTFRTQQ